MRRAICDYDPLTCIWCCVQTSIAIFAAHDLWLWSSKRSSIAVFDWDFFLDATFLDAVSFRLSFTFRRYLFRTFFWTMRGSELVAYPQTRLFWTPSLSNAVSFFGRSLFGRYLFRTFFCVRTLSISDFLSDNAGFWCGCFPLDADLSGAVYFGRRCSSSGASVLPWTRMLLFLWTRVLFLGRGCFPQTRLLFLGPGFLWGIVENLYPCTMIYLSRYIE